MLVAKAVDTEYLGVTTSGSTGRELGMAIQNHCHNDKALIGQSCPGQISNILPKASRHQARKTIARWSGYAPTPLRSLLTLAAELGVSDLWYKDESCRFDLASFKALGGAYAVQSKLQMIIGEACGHKIAIDEVDRYRQHAESVTVVTATDGNHGRSVAWGAERCGCRCVVYMHEQVSPGRQEAVEVLGARVQRVKGNYDDSVRQAAEDAKANGWLLVSDTSWPGYEDIPRTVMAGYTVMSGEAMDQWPNVEPPTHVFIQGGCGGLAGSVFLDLWCRYGPDRPRFIVVEPQTAACLYESACAGKPSVVKITTETLMAGLSCGETSHIAWRILETAVDDFLTINDDLVGPLMRRLAQDESIVAGESAVSGLAGLTEVMRDQKLADQLGVSEHSRILVFGTEGATDPAIYDELVMS
ncbi:MAG: diaminopropionate ammonia-lyase [Phycisphaerales bacterium]|nr:diaminopropionate ammonia-lyase [Phycisphaerales bacterium]